MTFYRQFEGTMQEVTDKIVTDVIPASVPAPDAIRAVVLAFLPKDRGGRLKVGYTLVITKNSDSTVGGTALTVGHHWE